MKAITTVLLICSSSICFSQSVYNFLNLPFNAKSAMSSSNSNLFYRDNDAFVTNPAYLNFANDGNFGVSYLSFFSGVNAGSSYYIKNFDSIGKIGFSAFYVNYGDFVGSDNLGNKTSTFGAYDLSLAASYSYEVLDSVFIGATTKFISSKLESYSSNGLALDLGTYYVISSEQIVIGTTLRQIGTQMKSYRISESLPFSWNLGFSKTLARLPLTFGAEFTGINNWMKYHDKLLNYFTFSGKLRANKYITIFGSSNLGQRNELEAKGGFDLTGINMGGVINWNQYEISYSYSNYGVIGGVQRIDFGFNLDSFVN